MINFIRRWLFNRNRYIYTYWNGSRLVKGDPIQLWRGIQQHEDFREDDFRLMEREELRPKLIGKLAAVFRDVFSVEIPDRGGLTELECFNELRVFWYYAELQKKNTEPTPTLQPLTEATPSPDSIPSPSTNDVSDS